MILLDFTCFASQPFAGCFTQEMTLCNVDRSHRQSSFIQCQPRGVCKIRISPHQAQPRYDVPPLARTQPGVIPRTISQVAVNILIETPPDGLNSVVTR